MLMQPPAEHQPSEAQGPPLDLLVVGGLTIDRFPNGHEQPGGSVVHAAHAMQMEGRRVAIVTLAGPEPAAVRGLRDLGRWAELHVQRVDRTIRYDHDESGEHRTLVLTASAGTLHHPVDVGTPRAALFAGIADELDASLGGQRNAARTAGAILQGWLRTVVEGEPVRPRRLASLGEALVDVLAGLDVLVASVEDLAAEADDPASQIDALRRWFGGRPILVVTGGIRGAWIGQPDGRVEHVPIARRIDVPTTVGAGDAFAARLLVGIGSGASPGRAAAEAAALAADFLAERARPGRPGGV